MWICYHQYRQAENAHGQMQYAYNLWEQIFTMLSAKPPNWLQWDHMTQNSFELFTSWAIAKNPNLANWTVDCNPRDRIISLPLLFLFSCFLISQGFYRTLPNCLPDPLSSSLCSKEGMAVYWLGYFYGCYRNQDLWVSKVLQMHPSTYGTLQEPAYAQLCLRINMDSPEAVAN